MVRLFIFLAAAQLALFVLALISCLSVEHVRALPRALWVSLIVVIPLAGPIAYFIWGRPASPPLEGSLVRRGARRPSSPDDDAEFLRTVDSEQSRRDRETLDQWEKDFGDDDK
jgi:hypothetical protein